MSNAADSHPSPVAAPVDHHAAEMIRAMETKLADLQRMSAEAARKSSELEARELDLIKARLEIEQQRAGVTRQQQELESQRTRVVAEHNEQLERLGAGRRELEQAQQELARLREQSQHTDAKLAERQQSLEQACAQLDAQRTELDTHRREIETTGAKLKQQHDELAARDAQLRQAQQEIQGERQRLERQYAEKIDARQRELDQQERQFQARATELAEQSAAQIKQARADLHAAVARADKADREVQEFKDRLAAAAGDQHRLIGAQSELQTRLDRAEAARAEAHDRCEKLEQELRNAHQAAGVHGAQLAELRARLEAVTHELETQTTRADEQSTLAEQFQEESAAHRERAEALDAQIEALRTQARDAVAHADELTKQMELAAADATKHKQDAEAARALVGNDAETRLQVESLILQRDKVASANAELEKTLYQREEQMQMVAQRLLAAEQIIANKDAELVALRERMSTGGADAAPAPRSRGTSPAQSELDTLRTHLMRRHARLRAYKALLSAQSRKILQARDALTRKAEQYDQVIAQRGRLADAGAKLEEEKRRVLAKAAKNSSAVLVFCVFATLAVVGALGWQIAGKLAPATYAARATIAADVNGRAAAQGELLAWTAGMEKLVQDPELMELAASRYSQRGMVALGTAGAVSEQIRTALSVYTDKPGVLTLELRAQGAERATRELETFVLALMATANHQRDTRGDGAVTVMTDAPRAGNEPIADQRLAYVAGVGGVGGLTALLLGAGVFQLLARSKSKFERDTALAAI